MHCHCNVVQVPSFGQMVWLLTIVSRNHLLLDCFMGCTNQKMLFLNDFVNEFQKLQTTEVINGLQKYDIVLAATICDTPARAFLTNVKGHTGYFRCDKCTQEGVFTERQSYRLLE